MGYELTDADSFRNVAKIDLEIKSQIAFCSHLLLDFFMNFITDMRIRKKN